MPRKRAMAPPPEASQPAVPSCMNNLDNDHVDQHEDESIGDKDDDVGLQCTSTNNVAPQISALNADTATLAVPGSDVAPWLRLTEAEVTALYRRSRKALPSNRASNSGGWRPSEALLLRELDQLGRGPAHYRQAREHATAAGNATSDAPAGGVAPGAIAFVDVDNIEARLAERQQGFVVAGAEQLVLGEVSIDVLLRDAAELQQSLERGNLGMRLNAQRRLKRERDQQQRRASGAAETDTATPHGAEDLMLTGAGSQFSEPPGAVEVETEHTSDDLDTPEPDPRGSFSPVAAQACRSEHSDLEDLSTMDHKTTAVQDAQATTPVGPRKRKIPVATPPLLGKRRRLNKRTLIGVGVFRSIIGNSPSKAEAPSVTTKEPGNGDISIVTAHRGVVQAPGIRTPERSMTPPLAPCSDTDDTAININGASAIPSRRSTQAEGDSCRTISPTPSQSATSIITPWSPSPSPTASQRARRKTVRFSSDSPSWWFYKEKTPLPDEDIDYDIDESIYAGELHSRGAAEGLDDMLEGESTASYICRNNSWFALDNDDDANQYADDDDEVVAEPYVYGRYSGVGSYTNARSYNCRPGHGYNVSPSRAARSFYVPLASEAISAAQRREDAAAQRERREAAARRHEVARQRVAAAEALQPRVAATPMHRANNASTRRGILRHTSGVGGTNDGLVVGDSARQWLRRSRKMPSSPSCTPMRQHVSRGRFVKGDYRENATAGDETMGHEHSTGGSPTKSPKVRRNTSLMTARASNFPTTSPTPHQPSEKENE